jgi:hypothetical protein
MEESRVEQVLAEISFLFANSFSPVEPIIIVFEVFNKTVVIQGNTVLVVSDEIKGNDCRIIKWIEASNFKDSVLWRSIILVPDLGLMYDFAIFYCILDKVDVVWRFFYWENTFCATFDYSDMVDMIRT